MAEVESVDAKSVTLGNWRTAPFSRWAFHHVQDLIPTARIAAPAASAPLVETLGSFEDFRLDLHGRGALDLPAFLAATATDGLVILRHGQVVFETYAGGTTRETPHILMSATKAVVGLMAGLLRREGWLDVDAPIVRYLPQLAETAYAGASVRDLLDMRSGVVLDDHQQQAYAAACNWDPVAPDAASATLHDFYAALPAADQAPGGSFAYVSANIDLLGWIMEAATGRPLAALISDLLWKPLGAEQAAFMTLDRAGAPRCTGGLCATVRDFARIGALLANGGMIGSNPVAPAAWIDDLFGGGDRDAWKTGEWGKAFSTISREMSYRAGWYVTHDRPGTMFAMGIHGQNLFVDRETGVVIAKVSSQADPLDYRALGLTHMAAPRLMALALRTSS